MTLIEAPGTATRTNWRWPTGRTRPAGAAQHLQVLRQRHRVGEHHHPGRGRQGHVRARRQRCRQVDLHQDPVRRAPTELGRVHDVRHSGALHDASRHTRPGIAAVFQDLALAPLLSVWRNFFLGVEPIARHPSCAVRSWRKRRQGRDGQDGHRRTRCRPAGRHVVGWRASVRRHRPGLYFGARVLILDEPTSALGVKQSGVVLKYTRPANLGVIFITHNPNHTIPVGDRFLLLNRGHSLGDFAKDEIVGTELTRLMAGGAELANSSTRSSLRLDDQRPCHRVRAPDGRPYLR